jgi:predicted PurR-regulated permease PerM
MKIQSTEGCSTYNDGFMIYITYVYYLILTGFLPIMITSIFATLAYSNVRRIVQSRIPIFRRRLDRQLTAMILVRVVFLVVVTLPYVIFRIYTLKGPFDQYDSVQKAIIQLMEAITDSLFYLNYSVCNIFVICDFIGIDLF